MKIYAIKCNLLSFYYWILWIKFSKFPQLWKLWSQYSHPPSLRSTLQGRSKQQQRPLLCRLRRKVVNWKKLRSKVWRFRWISCEMKNLHGILMTVFLAVGTILLQSSISVRERRGRGGLKSRKSFLMVYVKIK